MSSVFIALQANEETRPIIEAIEQDNPNAVVNHQPAMVKIDCEDRIVVRREREFTATAPRPDDKLAGIASLVPRDPQTHSAVREFRANLGHCSRFKVCITC